MRPIDGSVVLLILTGLISILGQVILLRELNVIFYGSEWVYIFSLGLWLGGAAMGALFQKRLAAPSPGKAICALLLSGILLPADIAFIRGSRILFGAVPGAFLPFAQQLFVAALALLPFAALTGLLFCWAAILFTEEKKSSRSLGMAYALESAGGAAGGLAGAACFYWGVQNLPLALALAYLTLLIPLLPGIKTATVRVTRYHRTAILLLFPVLAWMWPFTAMDEGMTRWNHPRLIASQDTPYGRTTLSGSAGQISMFENDALVYETEGTDAEAFIHPAALQHPSPQKILVLGGGVEGLVGELLRHHPRQIDYVEINAVMLKTVVPHLPPDIRTTLQDPHVRVIQADPRSFLKQAGFYDLIVVGMPEPDSGAANRFYSKEFFLQCAARLSRTGILALRLKTPENFWTPSMVLRVASIYQALRTVFPEYLFLPGPVQVITASFSPLPRSSELLVARWQERRIKSNLIHPAYLSYLYANSRFREMNRLLENASSPVNTDNHPVCYQFSAMIWLAKFFPALNKGTFSNPFQQGDMADLIPYTLSFMMLLAIFGVMRRFPETGRLILMAAGAFVGMVLETVLLLYYQTKQGVLYQDIGMLLTGLMVGLALGAIIFQGRRPNQAWGVALAVGFFLTAVLLYRTIVSDPVPGLAQVMLLLILDGFFVSALFSYLSLFQTPIPRSIVSPLYSADLIGGSLGALISGLLLIPFFGLDMTAAFMIIMNAALLLLVR